LNSFIPEVNRELWSPGFIFFRGIYSGEKMEGYCFAKLNNSAIFSSWFIVIYSGDSIRIETSILISAMSILFYLWNNSYKKYANK
jgi:hypothetical protein